MELIIKPTGKCNFKCSFCSSCDVKTYDDPRHVHPKLLELIDKIKPYNLLVNGGDPLLMNPEWYYELHDKTGLPISITTNLKDFYLFPTKWAPLFNEQWMHVGTSFQYGSGRMWDAKTVFDEGMFIKVVDRFRECTNCHSLPFIAVIDYENEHLAIDHVLLAKRLDTTVKMNNAIPVGRCGVWYPRYKMFQIYIKIIEMGLEEYESNCAERSTASCPRNTFYQCNRNIRSCYIDTDQNLHVSNCDEFLVQGVEYTTEGEITGKDIPVTLDPREFIKEECTYCPLCRLCNGCNLNRKYAKQDPNYCNEMLKLEDQIFDYNWIL